MNESKVSRFKYTKEELELNKVITFVKNELEKMYSNNERLIDLYDEAILRAVVIARNKGVSDEQLKLLKFKAENNIKSPYEVPESVLSWHEIVSEADRAILGDVILEDICSNRDFEDAATHINEIEKEFKELTGLTKTDVAFMTIAIVLQCARQYVLQPFLDEHRFTHKQGDSIKKIIPKDWRDILCCSVPYDAIERLNKDSDKTGLAGTTHRYRTLGHDPILGWFFGPVNILSDSLTKTDFVTSYEVVDKKIGSKMLTPNVLNNAYEQAKIEFNLPVAVIRHAIHFGSDYFTKQGLPIPFISSINNDVSKFLINNNINMLNVTEGVALSSMINCLISCIHNLFNVDGCNRELYEVRTRKILSISNVVASTSNIAYVAISKNAKKLDLGGLLVTIRRLCTDIRFIARVKQEFIEGKLDEEWRIISEDIDRLCNS